MFFQGDYSLQQRSWQLDSTTTGMYGAQENYNVIVSFREQPPKGTMSPPVLLKAIVNIKKLRKELVHV